MAKLPIARIQMVQAKVIQFLINILGQRGRKVKELTCSSALDKTVSKAVLALARLSQDSSTADMAIKLGGLRELVKLLRVVSAQENEIPMAIMVAVKTITSCCNVECEAELGDCDDIGNSSESFV
jgi:hypothetical protein